jgi:hypothetical protein
LFAAGIVVLDDKQDRVELPKHVCFKGDNGMYLSARTIEGYPYLQFSSGDIGDPSVRFTIHPTSGGHIRIKSEHFNRFWRRSPNWIWADSSDTSSDNLDTLFRVVRIGDGSVFALQNLGNNNFCKRLTTEGKVSCLNAATPTITTEARLEIQEAVLSRRIYEIEYHLDDVKIIEIRPRTLITREAANNDITPHTTTIGLNYSVTNEKKWESSVSLKLGISTSIQAGVPKVGIGATVVIETETTESYAWGESITTTEEISSSIDVTVLPQTVVTVSMLASEGTCEVPFSYTQEDILTNGEKLIQRFHDGIFRGVNSFDFKSDVSGRPL